METLKFKIGDKVKKCKGDYQYEGTVVAAFHKLHGLARYVVEDNRGMLLIFNGEQLELQFL